MGLFRWMISRTIRFPFWRDTCQTLYHSACRRRRRRCTLAFGGVLWYNYWRWYT
jgi:hypothetical protein